MKKKPAAQSAFFNPRFLICFAICAIGAVIALLAFALYPGGNALAQDQQQDQIEQRQVEGDQAAANLVLPIQIEVNKSVDPAPPLQTS
jgi:hypothetical protein